MVDNSLKDRLEAEQLRQLLARPPVSLYMAPMLGIGAAAILWNQADGIALTIWLAVLLVVYALRMLVRRSFLRSTNHSGQELARTVNRVIMVAALTGGIWGALPFVPLAGNARVNAALIGFIISGVTSAAVTTLSAHRAAAMAFVVPCLTSYLTWLLWLGDAFSLGLGAMTAAYFIVSMSAIRSGNANLTDNVRLRLRADADAAELNARDARLRDQQTMMTLIVGAQSRFIQSDDAGATFNALLDDLLTVTRSEFGLIADFLHDNNSQPYLRARAIADIPVNDAVLSPIGDPAGNVLEFHNLNNLMGAAALMEEPIIANDPSNDPRNVGAPPSHPPLTSFLGLPIKRGPEMLGLLCIANRAGGYSQADVEYLRPALHTIAQMLHALRGEEQRRLAEQRTLRTRAQLETFIAFTPASVAMLDEDLRLLAYSERWRKDFSLPFGDLHGELLYDLLPETPVRWRECYDRALHGEVESEEADPYISTDGNVRWFHWEVRPWREDSDRVGGVVMFYEDVTETKRAIDAAHARERLLDNLAARVPGMLFQLRYSRSEDRITLLYASGGAHEIYGKTVEELMDDPEHLSRVCHPDDVALRDATVAETMQNGGVLRAEHRILNPGGRERWIRVECSIERLADASHIWHGYVRDITEQKLNEATLAKLRERLADNAQQQPHRAA